MTTVIIRLKIKLPDGMTDKEYNELAKKYLDLNPVKAFRISKTSDELSWLY